MTCQISRTNNKKDIGHLAFQNEAKISPRLVMMAISSLFENQLFLVGNKPIAKMRRQHWGDFENCRIRDIWNHDNKSVKNKAELEQYNTVLPDRLYNQIYCITTTVYKIKWI